jgi:DNA-binding NtrC family response regulator
VAKKILIYDDDVEILLLCKAILSKHNYQVETLCNCEDIIKDVQSISPNIILMDLWIPSIGGEKAVEILKKNKSTSHIPVLLFSANADIKEISLRINAEGYIEKPFTLNVLIQTIEKHIV